MTFKKYSKQDIYEINQMALNVGRSVCIYIYTYITSEKPVNDQYYGVLDRYDMTILYK